MLNAGSLIEGHISRLSDLYCDPVIRCIVFVYCPAQ